MSWVIELFIKMAVQVTISSATGLAPYDIFICQTDGTNCFFISTQSTFPYVFDIPAPNNTWTSYMLKLVDSNNCVITGTTSV